MKSRTITTAGVLVTNYGDGSQQISYPSSSRDWFSCVSNTGDRKSPTYHYFTKDAVSSPSGSASYHNPDLPILDWYKHGIFSPASNFPNDDADSPAMRASLYNQALSKLSDKVRGGLDLSIDAAELGQTRRMLQNVTKIVERARQFRRRPTRAIADAWLEFQYGWRPLIQDAYEALHKVTPQGGFVVPFKARASEPYENTVNGPSFVIAGSGKTIVTGNYRHEIKVWLESGQNTTQSVAGYTSLNPVSIAWEVLPFSFVADWFYNVGGYLRTLETGMLNNSRFKSGYSCYSYRVQGRMICNGASKSGNAVTVVEAGGSWTRTMKERKVLGSFPLPQLPVMKVDLGSQRLFSAAALLHQFLK